MERQTDVGRRGEMRNEHEVWLHNSCTKPADITFLSASSNFTVQVTLSYLIETAIKEKVENLYKINLE